MDARHDFSGKIAIVTGATKGIGRAIALGLIRSRARVALTYASDKAAASEMEVLLSGEASSGHLLVRSDVSQRSDVRSLLEAVRERWAEPVSLIVNNAGILKQGDFFSLSDEQWDRTLRTNLRGPFMLCQEAIRDMGTAASIVNIASVGGQTGGDRAPDYAASKAGLTCLTKSLARIGSAYGVRVNAVSPGWIETEIFAAGALEELRARAREAILLGRLGTTEEVAAAVLFLLSEEASYITGHCLNVNGGLFLG